MSIVETVAPAQIGYAQEAMQQLREAIQHLPPEEKEVFLPIFRYKPDGVSHELFIPQSYS